MDPRLYAEQAISEAIADGSLDSGVHAGRPLPSMLPNDDGWWIRSFLEREQLPDRYAEALRIADSLLRSALAAATLDQARAVLKSRSEAVAAWNEKAPQTHRLDIVDEPDLVALRNGLATKRTNES
jgi:hypothetical protein